MTHALKTCLVIYMYIYMYYMYIHMYYMYIKSLGIITNLTFPSFYKLTLSHFLMTAWQEDERD